MLMLHFFWLCIFVLHFVLDELAFFLGNWVRGIARRKLGRQIAQTAFLNSNRRRFFFHFVFNKIASNLQKNTEKKLQQLCTNITRFSYDIQMSKHIALKTWQRQEKFVIFSFLVLFCNQFWCGRNLRSNTSPSKKTQKIHLSPSLWMSSTRMQKTGKEFLTLKL